MNMQNYLPPNRGKLKLLLVLWFAIIFESVAFPNLAHAQSLNSQKIPNEKYAGHLAHSTMTVTVKAPIDYLWKKLVDFNDYPNIFSRIQSTKVTKSDGNLVYIETYLKPQLFVKSQIQHTVNDLSGKPNILSWKLADGNFKYVEGQWSLKPLSATTTQLKYHLATDFGPIVPATLVSFVLHFVQREIVTTFTNYTEKSYNSLSQNPRL